VDGFEYVLNETERVHSQLVTFLGSRRFNSYLLLGMIPNATRRIIIEIGRNQIPQDEAILELTSRMFNHALSAHLLIFRGLVVDSVVMLRAMVETNAQVVAFLRDSVAAEAWLKGKRFKPEIIRKILDGKPDLGPIYARLSAMAHANPEGRAGHVVQVPPMGTAILYGGSYQPKHMAELLSIVVDQTLLYLMAFHQHYKGRLSVENWPLMIKMGLDANADFIKWIQDLPDDLDDLREHMRNSPPLEPMRRPEAYLNMAKDVAREFEEEQHSRNLSELNWKQVG